MTEVKVCLWNIQNYGSGDVSMKWGPDSDLRNRFITDFIRAEEIDVLLIMEMSTTGEPSLSDLVSTLLSGKDGMPDWAASYCGSALARRAADPPTDKSQLKYKTGARTEGYAVLWRTGSSRYSVVPSLNRISETAPIVSTTAAAAKQVLNINTTGRPADNDGLDWRPLGGYTTGYVYPYDGKTVMDSWPQLDFPGTGKYDSLMRWTEARRPIYVVLDLKIDKGTPKQRLCPVGAYHAPSKLKRAELGALQAGLCRELYVVNDLNVNGTPKPNTILHTDRVVLGGDFNYEVKADVSDPWPGYYGYFTSPYLKAFTGGANCGVAPRPSLIDAERQTVIRLLKGKEHDEVITGASIDAYLSHMIDLVFFRGTGVSAERVNIPSLLLAAVTSAPYAATLQRFHTHLDTFVKGLKAPNQRVTNKNGPQKKVDNDWLPIISGGWGAEFQNWKSLMAQLSKGQLTTARQAAEFYQIFVSDHLPLVVTLEF
ncbi:MAG TPA: hypothetical protein VFU13_10025 [Steroidobacteraceae bacterium]|nr:hypothetical protein [Steroidobacteraceae bacterium]